MNELVSVYISTHNRVEKLKRAINSVQNQSYENIELIVSDDASEDGTSDMMNHLCSQDKRIKYIRSEKNNGACLTRNAAINIAKGKFITGLDDDDEFTSDRISIFLDEWDDESSFICANFQEEFSDGRIKNYFQPLNQNGVTFNYRDLLHENQASNQIFTLTERLISIGGFKTDVKRFQDWDTWLRLSYKYGSFFRLDKALYIMHHDHAYDEPRVSSSYPLKYALRDFLERNKIIFGDEYLTKKYFVDYLNNNLILSDACRWACKEKSIKNIIRYFIQYKNK